jgi:putative transposase
VPRPPRYELVGVPQHVIHRGNNRQATFFADEDYRAYLGWLGEAAERHGCSIHDETRDTQDSEISYVKP